jgi:glyoxylase-like metal-dependent hydrolase (beta-lactamase superfamily II)
MTDHTLRYINAYLLDSEDGYILVDCGWGLPEVRQALEGALSEIGVRLSEIRMLIVTHFHADHFGMAGTIAHESNAKVVMHRLDWAILERTFRDVDADFARRQGWLARNGFQLSDRELAEWSEHVRERVRLVRPTRELEDDEVLTVGGRRLRVIWTPGHSPGHICLFDEEHGVVLSGDHILPGITPHVGYWGQPGGDPLGMFLESLRKVDALGAKSALPAHREPIDDLGGRIAEILAHHGEREGEILANLGQAWRSGADIAASLSWRRGKSTFASLPAMQQVLALVETLAHLEHLRGRGSVERIEEDGALRYRSAAG